MGPKHRQRGLAYTGSTCPSEAPHELIESACAAGETPGLGSTGEEVAIAPSLESIAQKGSKAPSRTGQVRSPPERRTQPHRVRGQYRHFSLAAVDVRDRQSRAFGNSHTADQEATR